MIFAVIICDIGLDKKVTALCMPPPDQIPAEPQNHCWTSLVAIRALIENLTPDQINQAVQEQLRRTARAPEAPPDRKRPSQAPTADS